MSSIDLDKFPTSETAKRMLKRVSPVYQNSYTAKWLYQVMGMELDEARSIVESLRDQAFTQTVTWAIEMQEHKYSIEPDESLTLDERRTRLFRKKTVKHPANPWFYENYIKNGWGIETELDEVALSWGRLLLTILRDDDNHLHAMLKDLREKKPSHLTLEAVWRLIFGDEEDAIQEHINANDGQAGDFDFWVHLSGYHDVIPYGTNIPIFSRDGILRHGGKACHGGPFIRGGQGLEATHPRAILPYHHSWDDLSTDFLDYWPVWVGEENVVAKEELPRYFDMSLSIEDKSKEISGDLTLPLEFCFHELVPFGTEGFVLPRGSKMKSVLGHGFKAMRNGFLSRSGKTFHGMQESIPLGHSGRPDLERERHFFSVGYSFEEDVSAEDKGHMELSLPIPDDVVPDTAEGDMSFEALRFLRHDGSVRHDGTYARGMPLRVSGDFEIIKECRDGEFCRGGSITHRSSPIQWPA